MLASLGSGGSSCRARALRVSSVFKPSSVCRIQRNIIVGFIIIVSCHDDDENHVGLECDCCGCCC
jgi:hypothetical protein